MMDQVTVKDYHKTFLSLTSRFKSHPHCTATLLANIWFSEFMILNQKFTYNQITFDTFSFLVELF